MTSLSANRTFLLYFAFVAVAFSAHGSDPRDILRQMERRFEAHENGYMQLERKIYVVPEFTLKDVPNAEALAKSTSESLIAVHDDAKFYYRRTKKPDYPDVIAYRLEIDNLLPVPSPPVSPSLQEVANYSVKAYRRILVRDPERNMLFLGTYDYRDPKRLSVTGLYEAATNIEIDRIKEAGRPVPLPVEAVFGQVALLGVSKKMPAEALTMTEKGDYTHLNFDYYGKGKITFTNKLLTAITAADGMFREIPNIHWSFLDYKEVNGVMLPSRVLVADISPAGDKAQSVAFMKQGKYENATYAGMIADFKFSTIDFDKPEYSEKVSFEVIEGKVVGDFRIPERYPFMHVYRDTQNLDEIKKMALKKNEQESGSTPKSKTPWRIIGASLLAAATVLLIVKRRARS